MKAVDKYILELDTNSVDVKNGVIKVGGIKLYLPHGQEDTYGKVPCVAKVLAVSRTNYFKLNVGETVVIDPFVYDNVVEEDIRYVNEYNPLNPIENMIYGVVRGGELFMLNKNILVDRSKREYKSDRLFTPDLTNNEEAVVIKVHEGCSIPIGSTISVFKDNFWPIDLFGEKAFMVNSKFSVPFYYGKGGEVVLMPDWILVSPIVVYGKNNKSKSGIIVPSNRHQSKNKAKIVQIPSNYNGPLKKGMTISYVRQDAFKITEGGKDYYFANIGERYNEVLSYR